MSSNNSDIPRKEGETEELQASTHHESSGDPEMFSDEIISTATTAATSLFTKNPDDDHDGIQQGLDNTDGSRQDNESKFLLSMTQSLSPTCTFEGGNELGGNSTTGTKASTHEKIEKILSAPSALPLSDQELGLVRALLLRTAAQTNHDNRVNDGDDDSSVQDIENMVDDKSVHSCDTETREQTEKTKLTSDTFSFLVVSPIRSGPFYTGLFVVFLKAAVFSLILASVIDLNDETNPLGIPTSVTGPVVVAQFLAMLITVATQDDLISSLHLVGEAGRLEFLKRAHPHTTPFKWILGTVLLFLTGALGLIVTFILVVTSSDLVELMLNFTAVEFVSLLDNVGFELAQQGLLGAANKKVALEIEENEYRIPKRRDSVPYKLIIAMVVSFLALLGAWGYVYYLQLTGLYTPNTLVVQFDDEVVLDLGAYSGVYKLRNNALAVGFNRIKYENVDGDGIFAYCLEQEVWTFTLDKSLEANPCENVLVRSSHSVSFDITESAGDQWFVTSSVEESRFFPMDVFHMALGCEEDSDCGGNGRGTCDDENECICNKGFYGVSCDFIKETTCPTLELDTASLFSQGFRQYARTYRTLMDKDSNESGDTPPEPLEVYDRHVFVSDFQDNRETDIVMFTGLRWILTEVPSNLNITDMTTLREYLKRPRNEVALSFLEIDSYFASEALRVNSPADIPVPFDLEWFPVRHVGTETRLLPSVDLTLFCATCNNETNPCEFGNHCPENGQCKCENGAFGTLCQNQPLGDGVCHNEFFNVGSLGFDGGDCCELTCVNQNDNICGVVGREDIGGIYVGFPQCVDTIGICNKLKDKDQGSCYLPKSNPVSSLSRFTEAMVTLSANGRTVAISEPSLDAVRIFEQVDANWLQRGSTLEGNRRSLFGRILVIARAPSEIIGRLNSNTPMVLAVGFGRPGQSAARVLSWLDTIDEWLQIGSDVEVCFQPGCDLIDMDVSVDGEEIILAATSTEQGGTATVFSIFSNATFTGPWVPILRTEGTHVSLSEASRGILAVAEDRNQMVRRYDIRAARFDILPRSEEVSPFLRSSHDLSAFGKTAQIKSIRIDGDGDKISAFMVNTVQVFSLLRFNSQATKPRPHRGTILEFDNVNDPPVIDFSLDGSVATVTRDLSSEGRVVHSLQFDENTLSWRQFGTDIQVSSRAEEFAISADGSTLAVGGDSPTEFFRLNSDCDGTSFQLSFLLDDSPSNVSWSIQSYQFLGDIEFETQTYSDVCDHCYADDLFRAMGFKSGCLPANECMRFHFEKDGGFDGDSGLVFTVNGTENGTLSSATEDSYDLVLHQRNACSLDVLSCEAGYAQLTMILDLDGHPEELSWYIRNSTHNTILFEDNYNEPGRDIRQYCVPSSECLSITFEDSAEDGFLSSSGSGQYSIYLDGRIQIRRDGDFGKGERFFFGNCMKQVVRLVEAELSFFYDPFFGKPNETSWTIHDSEGREIGQGGPYLDLEDLRLQLEEKTPPLELPCNVGPQAVETSSGVVVASGDFFDAEFLNSSYIGGSYINATVNGAGFVDSTFFSSTIEEGTFTDTTFKESLILGGSFEECIFIDCVVSNGTFDQSLFFRSELIGGEFNLDFFYNETIVGGGTFVGATFLRDEMPGMNSNFIRTNESTGVGLGLTNLQNEASEDAQIDGQFMEPPETELNATANGIFALLSHPVNGTASPNNTLNATEIVEDMFFVGSPINNMNATNLTIEIPLTGRDETNIMEVFFGNESSANLTIEIPSVGINNMTEGFFFGNETFGNGSLANLNMTFDILPLGFNNGTGFSNESDIVVEAFVNGSTGLVGSGEGNLERDTNSSSPDASSADMPLLPPNYFTFSGDLLRTGIELDGEGMILNETQYFPNTSAVFINSTVLYVDFDSSALFNETDFVFQRFDLLTANLTVKQAFNLSSLSDLWTCEILLGENETMHPSVSPSERPSQFPSVVPSMSPSAYPSFLPSEVPSQAPTKSASPSDVPSSNPSMSMMPTVSENPSLTPSGSSSPSHSNEPTMAPSLSKAPSNAPTVTATTAPTESQSPSGSPITPPSSSPSTYPSASPTVTPDPDPYRLCETEYDSRFDLCGQVFNYTELFEFFGEDLDFVELFGRIRAMNFTAPPDPEPIAVRARFSMYPDEQYTLTVSDSGQDGILGTYQILTVSGQILLKRQGDTFDQIQEDTFLLRVFSGDDNEATAQRHTSGPPKSDMRR